MKDTHVRAPWHRLLAVLLGLALVVAACGSDSDEGGASGDGGTDGDETTTTTEAPESNPVKGGSLVFGNESDVSTLEPGKAAQPADMVIGLGLFDPLTTWQDGELVPYLAETIEASEDLQTYSMTLRSGVTFHDGTPLNADAVVKHFERMASPEYNCPCRGSVEIIGSMDMPDGPEGLSVVFNLTGPNVAFPNMLAGSTGWVGSPTAVEALGASFASAPVGTGPFKMKEFSPGERVVLEAYEGYWQSDDDGVQLPYLDQITFLPIPDTGQRVAALRTGDIDIFQTADSDTVVDAEAQGFASQKISGSSSTILLMNNAKPPFDDVRARQALAYAIDKDVINDRVYDGVREPSYSGFATDSSFYNPDAGTPQYDPDKAKELVEELGGLEFTLVCIPTPEADGILQLVKQMGEQAGMKITLETQEQGTYVDRIFSRNGDYEAACFRSAHFIEPDAVRPGLTTDDPGNLVFYSNPEVDQLLEEARQTADADERREKYFRVQEITGEEVPLITSLYDLFGNVYNADKVGPPPPGEANSLGAIKPGFLYATGG